MKRKYIFVLCPAFQGSTMIVNLLNSSPNVSTLLDKNVWAGEAQWLYANYGDKNYMKNRYDPNYKLNINVLNKVLNAKMDKRKIIWVEKSPSHICRAKMIQDYFSKLGDVYFIISIRSPYSTGHYDAEKWIQFAKYQKYNLENLKNTVHITYEECCQNLDSVISKITTLVPELGKLSSNDHKKFKNERGHKIHDKKVNRIINKDAKNKVLKNNIELMKYFGYDIIE